MSNDEIILDIMKRLIKLEREVEKLKEEKESDIENLDEEIGGESTATAKVRSQLRSELIDLLRLNIPSNKTIRVSNRDEGSGITIEDQDGTKKSYILRTSNNVDGNKSKGLFSIQDTLVDKIINNSSLSGIIFYSYYGDADEDIVVVMDAQEFRRYMTKKGFDKKDKNGKYYMYIKRENNSIVEFRDSKIDITEYSNKFKI